MFPVLVHCMNCNGNLLANKCEVTTLMLAELCQTDLNMALYVHTRLMLDLEHTKQNNG